MSKMKLRKGDMVIVNSGTQKGQKGESKITRKIEKQNGKITEALIVSTEVLKEPVNKIVKVGKMLDDFGKVVEDAKIVQQKLHFYTDVDLSVGDILRRKA